MLKSSERGIERARGECDLMRLGARQDRRDRLGNDLDVPQQGSAPSLVDISSARIGPRHDTLTEANDAIVNFHHAQPVSAVWGDGTLSSSDGQHFAVGVQTPVAGYQRMYFVDKGATIYCWTSDQHIQYGSKLIPANRPRGHLRARRDRGQSERLADRRTRHR